MADATSVEELTARFSRRARERIRDAKFEDVVAFVKVSDLAKGSQHANFAKTFPKKKDGGGVMTLVARIKRDAAREPDRTAQLDADLVRLVADIHDRSDRIGADLRDIAANEFDNHHDASVNDLDDQVRALMVAVARKDRQARRLLAERYRRTDAAYADRYRVLLAAMGRKPIPELADYQDFALAIASVLTGFLTRATIEADAKHVRELFQAIIVPVFAAVTYPTGSDVPTDHARLFTDVKASFTAGYPRTPVGPGTAPIDDLHDLTGTWQGTLDTDVVTRDAKIAAGPREAYVVIITSGDVLKVTQYLSTGVSRMITPAFVPTRGGRRMSCMYEAERTDNPNPDHPSHRGAWLLQVDEPALGLDAMYFNDRGGRGRFTFTHHESEIADGFHSAQDLFADRPWAPPRADS